MKRKALVAGIALIGSVLAGCGGTEASPPPPQEEPEAPTQPSTPPRTGPAKSVDVADKCAIVAESQWRALGADQAPRARDSNGVPGCNFQKGLAGDTGWTAFVAANGARSYGEELERRTSPTASVDLGGYPATTFQGTTGCIVIADIADKGYLLVNAGKTSPDDPGVDLCEQGKKFAEAAIQTLPNA